MQFNSIWYIDRTLLGATIPGQSEPESDSNEGVLRIPQSSRIAGTPQSDCYVSYPGQSFRGGLTPLQKYSRSILQPQPAAQNIGRVK